MAGANPAAGPQAVVHDLASARTAVSQLAQAGEDMLSLGQLLESRAHSITWECAKANRYRDSVAGRRTEARRIGASLQSASASIALLLLIAEAFGLKGDS